MLLQKGMIQEPRVDEVERKMEGEGANSFKILSNDSGCFVPCLFNLPSV